MVTVFDKVLRIIIWDDSLQSDKQWGHFAEAEEDCAILLKLVSGCIV